MMVTQTLESKPQTSEPLLAERSKFILRWKDPTGINCALCEEFTPAMTLAICLQHTQQSHTTIHSIEGELRYANPPSRNDVLRHMGE